MALADVAGVVRDGLLGFCADVGLVVMRQLMDAELTRRIGPKHARLPGRVANGHGTTTGPVVLGGRRVSVERPRGGQHREQDRRQPPRPKKRPPPNFNSGRDILATEPWANKLWHKRLHIALEDELVAELDRRVGPRGRSAFIAEMIRRGLDDERRWDDIEASLGQLPDTGHEWDDEIHAASGARGRSPTGAGMGVRAPETAGADR